MLGDEEGRIATPPDLGMLVDSNAFGRRAWIQALIDSSEAGHVRLYWSPTIIEEMARFRQLLWIRNWMRGGGTHLTDAVTRRFSEEAHRWMDFVSPHFFVVEDKPPHAPAWIDPLPDPYDAPIWTAARRAEVDVIVTQNLKDGPPENEHGVRVFDGVLYLDPAHLPVFLDWWGDLYLSGELAASSGDAAVADNIALPTGIREFLLDVERRRGIERPSSQTADDDT
jgi:hypothetical protein